MTPITMFYIFVFLYGIVIGSFLNVCICRLPDKESIVKGRSHCTQCSYQLKWYDLVPLFSYLMLGGRCRKCRQKISIQYPLIEGLNGICYIIIFMVNGISIESVIFCLLASALITLGVIDYRTFEIPVGINIFILTLGLIRAGLDYRNILTYGIGFFAVSGFLYLIILVTKGNGIGGGDMKLMAVCGLILGWKLIIFAFLAGCIIASVVHVIRMKVSKAGHVLAFGPYLSIGVFLAMLWGEPIIKWYFGILT